jgi:hypothetical protein
VASISSIFSSPGGGTPLKAGRNQIVTLSADNFSSIRIYAFIRGNASPVDIYLINPDLHDHVGTDPTAGMLDKLSLGTGQGRTAWYPLPGMKFSIEAFATKASWVDLFLYGEQ